MRNHNKFYTNPVLQGFYPDPAICRAGADYYLVCSSFAYFPGLPVFHCTDLVSWKLIGHAISNGSQMQFDGLQVSEGLWAPAITYHKGIFYITCTLMPAGRNFIITATDPRGPWSQPQTIEGVEGIDPSLFFDASGKGWIVYNSVAPGNAPQWEGHRSIRLRPYDPINNLTGPETLLIDGGVDRSQHPVWIEGPHIYFIDGWYYLLCAEGGTGFHHSAVIFRSRNVEGPYESSPQNPVLTQRTLDDARPHPITTAGHADMVQTPQGDWHAVFLACRPYKGRHFNTGRETFLAPVTWNDGWPQITAPGDTVRYFYPLPHGEAPVQQTESGNFNWQDDFDSSVIQPRYLFLRGKPAGITCRGALHLQPGSTSLGDSGTPSFIGFRQQHLRCTVTTNMSFEPQRDGEGSGLVIFQDEQHYYFLCLTLQDNRRVVEVQQGGGSGESTVYSMPAPAGALWLRIESRDDLYHFSFSADGTKWTGCGGGLDATYLSTETAGGFVGCVFGLYGYAKQPGNSAATFHFVRYEGRDLAYLQEPGTI